MDETIQVEQQPLTLVTRKPCFGLQTACTSCLPVYIYLKFANIPFNLRYNLTYPDSDQIPYIDSDAYVTYNNEKGGVIESLKETNIVNLDAEVQDLSGWVSTIAMIKSWLSDALLYELWVGSDGSSAHIIYYSDLPWPIGKLIYMKQVYNVKQLLGISKDNAERREAEIYRRATIAYNALSTKLGEDTFFTDNRPTSLDAIFLGHALITLHALPETSVLSGKLLGHANLVTYVDKHKAQFLDTGSSSSYSDPSSSSSVSNRGPSDRNSKPKSQAKRERTEEEKSLRKKAKYFLVTQMVAVVVFLGLLGGSKVEADGDEGFDYE